MARRGYQLDELRSRLCRSLAFGAVLRFVFAAARTPRTPTICTGLASGLVAR